MGRPGGHLGSPTEIGKVNTEPEPVDEFAVGPLRFVDPAPIAGHGRPPSGGAVRVCFNAQHVVDELRRRERPALV